MKTKIALPGDALAVPEEFIPGKNVYERNGAIRALLPGSVVRDLARREIHVEPASIARVPSVGDVVTGQIEVAQTSTASMKIYYLNGKPAAGGFSGIVFLRQERGGRGVRRTQMKLGDIVRAKVASTMNGMIHLVINEYHLGVIASLCSTCGRPLAGANGRSKCDECGSVEDRKFADDFGREPVQP
jgi:exosome complex RNA-binding protein Csl4